MSSAEQAYPPVPAPGVGEGTVPYNSAYEPAPGTPPHPAPAAHQEQQKGAGNVVYMTEAELKQVVVQPGTQVVMVTQATQRACECTAGWVLFGVGFVFPICWLVGVFLWLCTKNRHDKHAAIGSGVAIAVYAIFLGLFLGLYVVPLTMATVSMVNNLANNPNSILNNPNFWNFTGTGYSIGTWNGTAWVNGTTSP